MKTLALGEGIDATAVAAQTAVTAGSTPFMQGREVALAVATAGITGGATSITVQSSNDDGTTWTDQATITAETGLVMTTFPMAEQVRLNVETAATAGTVSAYLIGGV